MMIVKKRNYNQNWWVYHSALGNTGRLHFNDTVDAISNSTDWGSTTPTSSVFYVGNNTNDSSGGSNYIALLFASCPGVSKVGTYSGNTGNNVDVDCGFTSNARFVMIRRTDTHITGTTDEETNWWIFDENLGIETNDDYVMQANTADPRVTANWLSPHPDNKGFRVNSGAIAALNATGGTYIFLAIA